jgi:hypothetical protein
MRCPADHEKYYSQPEAQDALRRLIMQARRTGVGGKSWKRLNVFPCGNHWHVGRANQLPAKYQPPAPHIPSTGELRRKLARIEHEWQRKEDYERRQRAEAIGKLIAAEQAVTDAENELRELQLQTIKLFLP